MPRPQNFRGKTINSYSKTVKIGSGTFGEVWKAFEPDAARQVALKLIKMDREVEGFPITALREIKLLKQLSQCENIVSLLDVAGESDESRGEVYMVFEYVEHDLLGLLEMHWNKFTARHVASFAHQLLSAVQFMHARQMLHRDLKCANILISQKNVLKVADLGLAKITETDEPQTYKVITLWYRPPELLLRSKHYGPEVDMWSVGCIFGELLQGRPILQGQQEADQLLRIFDLCGTPTEESWPGVSSLPDMASIPVVRGETVKYRFRNCRFASYDGLELLTSLLECNPRRRITATEALHSRYFLPPPPPPETLEPLARSDESCHEHDSRLAKEKRRDPKLEDNPYTSTLREMGFRTMKDPAVAPTEAKAPTAAAAAGATSGTLATTPPPAVAAAAAPLGKPLPRQSTAKKSSLKSSLKHPSRASSTEGTTAAAGIPTLLLEGKSSEAGASRGLSALVTPAAAAGDARSGGGGGNSSSGRHVEKGSKHSEKPADVGARARGGADPAAVVRGGSGGGGGGGGTSDAEKTPKSKSAKKDVSEAHLPESSSSSNIAGGGAISSSNSATSLTSSKLADPRRAKKAGTPSAQQAKPLSRAQAEPSMAAGSGGSADKAISGNSDTTREGADKLGKRGVGEEAVQSEAASEPPSKKSKAPTEPSAAADGGGSAAGNTSLSKKDAAKAPASQGSARSAEGRREERHEQRLAAGRPPLPGQERRRQSSWPHHGATFDV